MTIVYAILKQHHLSHILYPFSSLKTGSSFLIPNKASFPQEKIFSSFPFLTWFWCYFIIFVIHLTNLFNKITNISCFPLGRPQLCFVRFFLICVLLLLVGFPGGSVVRNPLAVQEVQETWVWSPGLEDPLEEGMTTHSSILAWRIPWTEKPGRLQAMGLQRVRHDWSNLTCT